MSDQAKRTHGFDRLMSRTVFSYADRVVRENVNVRQSRQRRQPNRGSGVIGKNKKGRARAPEKSMIGNAVQDCAHPMLTNTNTNVAAALIDTTATVALYDLIHG